MRAPSSLSPFLLLAGIVSPSLAQEWQQVATTGPVARIDGSIAFDGARGRAVLFGGSRGGPNALLLGDTWEWDGVVWHPRFVSGPTAREFHAMAYDSRRQRVVLQGGAPGGDETWEWNGVSWIQAASAPFNGNQHAMAYDSSRNRTVAVVFASAARGETWLWDGTTWVHAVTSNGPGRAGHAMAFDSHRNRTVLFGGNMVSQGLQNDLWEWDGTAWTEIASPNRPSARQRHAMVYDSARRVVILFGGLQDNAGTVRGDTWAWNGTTWTSLGGDNYGPGPRFGHTMAFDSHRAVAVTFGGSLGNGLARDTWHWNGPGSASSFGTGCGVPPLTLTPIATARPIIGTTAGASLGNIPSPVAFVALGWSRDDFGTFPLPVPLTSFGLPGCDLLQSSESPAEPVLWNGPGSATYNLQIPVLPGLLGLHLYLQGWAVAPGANAAGTIVSNGVEWILGNA